MTGVFMAFPDFATKWLGLLKDTLPRALSTGRASYGIRPRDYFKRNRLRPQLKRPN